MADQSAGVRAGSARTLSGPERRARELAEVDEDWNPVWAADWQRQFVAVRGLLADGAALADIAPSVTVHGEDAGRWLARQREHAMWTKLLPEQRDRLAGIGIEPLPAPTPKKAVNARTGASGAFERGIAALRQYTAEKAT